jgi:hypothetical protein
MSAAFKKENVGLTVCIAAGTYALARQMGIIPNKAMTKVYEWTADQVENMTRYPDIPLAMYVAIFGLAAHHINNVK